MLPVHIGTCEQQRVVSNYLRITSMPAFVTCVYTRLITKANLNAQIQLIVNLKTQRLTIIFCVSVTSISLTFYYIDYLHIVSNNDLSYFYGITVCPCSRL